MFFSRLKKKQKYTCPVCGYRGVFNDEKTEQVTVKDSTCPKCGSRSRHRLQKLVMDELSKRYDFSKMKILHVAPEVFFRSYFQKIFKKYVSCDLTMEDVDVQADLRKLPFGDSEYDIVYASHVLEHIKEDTEAVAEIRRVLRPGGMAVLHVPILAEKTIEYPEPNPHEYGHVRCAGLDYYDRLAGCFGRFERYQSEDFPEEYQTFAYGDWSIYPTEKSPLRPSVQGDKHSNLLIVGFRA